MPPTASGVGSPPGGGEGRRCREPRRGVAAHTRAPRDREMRPGVSQLPRDPYIPSKNGAWRSLVAHPLWERKAVGSNPAAPMSCPRSSAGQSGRLLSDGSQVRVLPGALVPQPAPGCDAHGRRLRRPALSLRHLRDGLAVRPSRWSSAWAWARSSASSWPPSRPRSRRPPAGPRGSPIVSLIILGLSGALILVDFSYLR